jgi:hypothetical protein
MSIENVEQFMNQVAENEEQFMNQVAENEELQARIGEEIDTESLIVLGAECGCEFTAEELQELSRHGGVAWRHWRSFPLPTKGLSFWRLESCGVMESRK